MRFFIVYLVFALSLTVSASPPKTLGPQDYFNLIRSQVDHFSKVSDPKSACGEPCLQKNDPKGFLGYNEIDAYTRLRSYTLSYLEAYTQWIAILIKEIHDDQSFKKVKDKAVGILPNDIEFFFFARTLRTHIPSEFPDKKKKEINDSITDIGDSIQWFYNM